MKKLFLQIIILLLGNTFSYAQAEELQDNDMLYVLESVSISGRTNVNRFKFIYDSTKAEKVNVDKEVNYIDSASDEVTFELPVRAFDSKNPIMNRDFYEMLKATSHPKIYVSIKKSVLESIAQGNPSDSIDMKLTLVGVTKKIHGELQNAEEKALLKGLTKVNLKEYPLDFPSKMLGFVNIDEVVSINFDVVIKQ
ncbi:MAG: YceI family protein [Bacteroidales bacterium]